MTTEQRFVNSVDQQWREQDWPAAEANAAFMAVVRVETILHRCMKRQLAELDLSVIDYGALVNLGLGCDTGCTLAALAENLLVAPTRLTYVIDRLQGNGLVERRPHDADRRSVLAVITTMGRERLDLATRAVAGDNFGFGDMDDSDLQILTRIMLRAFDAASSE